MCRFKSIRASHEYYTTCLIKDSVLHNSTHSNVCINCFALFSFLLQLYCALPYKLCFRTCSSSGYTLIPDNFSSVSVTNHPDPAHFSYIWNNYYSTSPYTTRCARPELNQEFIPLFHIQHPIHCRNA